MCVYNTFLWKWIYNYGLLYQIKHHKTKNQQDFGPGLLLEPKEDVPLPKTPYYRRYLFIVYLSMLYLVHFPLLHA
jgi:hypothetical protein